MAQLAAGLQWLRAHLLPTLLAVAVAVALVYFQLAQNRAQARLTEAQQRLQVMQAQAARVEAQEKKTQNTQQVIDALQNNLLTGDLYYGRLSAVQRAERESGARVTAFTPGAPEAISAAPALHALANAPAPQSEAEQVAAMTGQAAAPDKPQPAAQLAANAPGTYKRYPVQVAAQGSATQVLAFLRSLERGSPVARIGTVELSTAADKGAAVTATVYFYGP